MPDVKPPGGKPAAGAKGKGKAGAGKKIFGLPRNAVIAGGAALAIGVIYFLYKRKSSGAAGTTATTTMAGQECVDAYGNPGATDSLGNCVTSDQLSGYGSTSGGTGSTGTGGTGTTGTTTKTTKTTKGTTPTKAAHADNPPPGFSVFNVTPTSASFQWSKQASPPCTGYSLTVYAGATLADDRPALSKNTSTISTKILKPGRKYTAKLTARPQAPGSYGASLTFTTPKAKAK